MHIWFQSWISRRGAGRDNLACRNQGPWKGAICHAILSIAASFCYRQKPSVSDMCNHSNLYYVQTQSHKPCMVKCSWCPHDKCIILTSTDDSAMRYLIISSHNSQLSSRSNASISKCCSQNERTSSARATRIYVADSCLANPRIIICEKGVHIILSWRMAWWAGQHFSSPFFRGQNIFAPSPIPATPGLDNKHSLTCRLSQKSLCHVFYPSSTTMDMRVMSFNFPSGKTVFLMQHFRLDN